MAFSKAKIQRFNELSGCAPPPGTYQPKWAEKPIVGLFEKSQRFNDLKKVEENGLPRSLKTPVMQRKKFHENRCSSVKKASPVHHNVTKLQQSTIIDSDVAMTSQEKPQKKDCSCSSNQETAMKNAAKIKNLMEKHQWELKRIESLKKHLDDSEVIISCVKKEVVGYKDKIFSLKSSNSELAERTSSLQNSNIEYRLKVAQLQDDIDCLTAERNQITMEQLKTKKELKDTESRIENLTLKAAQAEAMAARESETKKALKISIDKKTQDLNDAMSKINDLLLKLDCANNDLAMEKAQKDELQNKLETVKEKAREEATKEVSLVKKKLIESYDSKLTTTENKLKVKLNELHQTRKELYEVKKTHEMEMICKKQKDKELMNVEKRLNEALQRIEELTLLSERSDNQIQVKLTSLMKLANCVLAADEEADKDQYSVDEITELFCIIIKELENMKLLNVNLERDLRAKESYCHELELLVGPFREQLELYDQERQALQNITQQTRGQLEQLSLQHAAALGHQNHKQKIRHLVQLKEHNFKLQEEVQELNNKLRHKDRIITKLSKPDKGDDKAQSLCAAKVLHISGKENSFSK